VLKRIIAFLRSRPTEVWLGLWAAIVAAVWNTGQAPTWVTSVSAVVGWLVTLYASRDSNSLGPQP
jgi:hypothetical protein